jgi:predicted nucleic-acid-binding Zn-ribbon protein
MYKCNKCGNEVLFEEHNVIKTCVRQEYDKIVNTSDEFFYREDVVCLECEATLNDGDITEK